MEKEQTIQDAIKNIDKNKKNIRASFVRGGATGLRQQRNIRKHSSSKKYESMKQDIKNQCNMFGEEIVIMQFGSTFDVVDENAEYFHKKFNFKYNPTTTNFFSTGFPLGLIEKYKKILLETEIKFCVVEEIFKEKDKPIIREVTFSSTNGPSLGNQFVGGIKK